MLVYIAAVCLLIVPALGVGLGSNCTNNGACDVTNSMCMKYTTCDMGMCKCKTGYMMTNATTCNEMKAYNEVCDGVTSYCTGNTTCKAITDDMSKCKCPDGMPWSTMLNMCSDKKPKGEMCTTVSDCYGGGMSTSCTVVEEGSIKKTCMCEAGYMAGTGMYMCSLPSFGETCSTMCMWGIVTPSDPSDDLTCDSTTKKCTCPTTYELVTMLTYGPMVKACIKKTENNYDDGVACTMNSDCDSYNCAMCPGVGSKTCLSMRTANAATTTRGAICMMLIGVIVSRFF